MSAIPSTSPRVVSASATASPWLPERVQGALLAAAFPIALVVLWHYVVVITGTRLVPTPYQVGVMR